MSLAPGVRLGPYEVLEAIGAGGMGEVYRARDTTLGRDVAIKVLPAAVAGDADRMARFQREAHVLASLNHPHIATIHGLEESGSVRALVMELGKAPHSPSASRAAPSRSKKHWLWRSRSRRLSSSPTITVSSTAT